MKTKERITDTLIVAAPLMRDTLQQARIMLDGLGHYDEREARLTERIDRIIRVALAKAEGKPCRS